MKKLNSRTPVVFHVGLVLLCMVLFSTYLTGGLYARYTTSASGEDGARVAKFQITNKLNSIDSQAVSVNLHFFDSTMLEDSLPLQVSSGSEVAVKYDVVVTMPTGVSYANWLSIQLKKDDTVLQTLTTTAADVNVFTFSDVGIFAPNDSNTHEYTLTFAIIESFQGNPPDGLTNIEENTVVVTVHAEQVD